MGEKSKGLKGPRPSERSHPSERRNRQGIRIEPGSSGDLQNRLATFSALVKHEPGVLAKVSGLFSRRQFNIESLTVGPTENENNARITLVVDENDTGIAQVKKQLAKLFPVIAVKELSENAIARELCLIKIEKGNEFEDLKGLIEKKGMEIIDTSEDVVTVEIRGDQRDIEDMIVMFDQFGIKEIARTGTVALERGSKKTT
jgi:acetolactate synthase-1/3 small subunit